MVNRMDVIHAILDHSAGLLQAPIATHCRYCVPLDEDIALGKELESFQR
jgi:hypothetical protein